MEVTVINPLSEENTMTGDAENSYFGDPEGHRKAALLGWARRKGLANNEADDFAEYYDNPRGWFGQPERHRVAALKGWAKRKGMPFKGMLEAVENAWYGESARHRRAALKGWARRRGLKENESQEFADFVENAWYGDPEGHRRAALIGWKRRRRGMSTENPMENILMKPLLPEELQPHLGVAGASFDKPHVGGGVIGLVDTPIYAGIGELASKNEHVGTVIGLGGGLLTSEAFRKYGGEMGEEIARGQRVGTYAITIVRLIVSAIRASAGVSPAPASALGQGLDEVVEALRKGDIVTAIRTPFMTGLGAADGSLGQALEIKFPDFKLPEFLQPTGQDDMEEERIGISQGLGQDEEVEDLEVGISQGLGQAREEEGLPFVNALGMAIGME